MSPVSLTGLQLRKSVNPAACYVLMRIDCDISNTKDFDCFPVYFEGLVSQEEVFRGENLRTRGDDHVYFEVARDQFRDIN